MSSNIPNYKEVDCCSNCKETEFGEIFIDKGEFKLLCLKYQTGVYSFFICDDYEQLWIGGEHHGN